MNLPRGYWTVEQTAEYYHVPEDTLRHWRHVGKGPLAVRPGRELLYPVAEIERYDAVLMAEASERAEGRNPRRADLRLLASAEGMAEAVTRRRPRRQARPA